MWMISPCRAACTPGQGDGQPGVRAGGGLDGRCDLFGCQRLRDRLRRAAGLDVAGRVGEHDAVSLRPSEQRPQGVGRGGAVVALQRGDVGHDVLVGDLAQLFVAGRPGPHGWPDGGDTDSDGLLVPGAGARAAVAEGACPPVGLFGDGWGEVLEFALQPGVECGAAVIEQDAHGVQDFRDVSGAVAAAAQHPVEVRETDHLSVGVVAQKHDQGAVDRAQDVAAPAAGFGQGVRDVQRPAHPWVVRRRLLAAVVAAVPEARRGGSNSGGCDQLGRGRAAGGGGGLRGMPLAPVPTP
jgi:hypothetical protein